MAAHTACQYANYYLAMVWCFCFFIDAWVIVIVDPILLSKLVYSLAGVRLVLQSPDY